MTLAVDVHRHRTVWIVFRNRPTEAHQRCDAQMTSDALLKTTTLPKRLTTRQLSARLRLTLNLLLASPQQRSVGNNSLHQHPQLNNSLLLSLNLNLLPRPRRLSSLRPRRSLNLSNHTWSPRLVRWIWMRITMTVVTRRRGRSRLKVQGTARSLATVLVTIDEVRATALVCWHCKDIGLQRFKFLCKKHSSIFICPNSFVDALMCLAAAHPVKVIAGVELHRKNLPVC